MFKVNEIYKVNDDFFNEYFEESDFGKVFKKINPDNRPFKVEEVDEGGRIYSISFDSGCKFTANQGNFRNYWCLWINSNNLEKVNCLDLSALKKEKEWYVMLAEKGLASKIYGPYDEKSVNEFAINLRKKFTDDAKIIVLKSVKEAVINVEFK